MSAAEGTAPQELVAALTALSTVVPSSSKVVRCPSQGFGPSSIGVIPERRERRPSRVGAEPRERWGCLGPAVADQGAMQAVCARCSRRMCRAIVLFQVAECAQTTPMIAPLPGDPNKKNFSLDGSIAFFKSGDSNPTQPNPPPGGWVGGWAGGRTENCLKVKRQTMV